jgi:hypothetical protein
VVGLSGPDGAGKSTLLRVAADAAAGRGLPIRTTYLYGCVLCRNQRLPERFRRALASPGTVALECAEDPGGTTVWQRLHAGVDTVELAVRLALARRRSARLGRPVVLLLTDRSPLDALAKHEPRDGGLTARWLRHLAGGYALIALLDAGGESLAARDGEHAAEGLDRARSAYRRWSTGMDRVLPIPTQELRPGDAARLLLDRAVGRDTGTRLVSTLPQDPAARAARRRAAHSPGTSARR